MKPWTKRERGFFKWWSSDDGMCRLYSGKGGQINLGYGGEGRFSRERGGCDFAVWEFISGLRSCQISGLFEFSFAQKRLRRERLWHLYKKCSLCHGR